MVKTGTSLDTGNDVNLSELGNWPNLLSLSRIALTPFIGWLLAIDTTDATLGCLGLLVLAGITDFLDGFVARRTGYDGKLGKMLDPIADKIMVGVLIILLILYRDFPIWLAVVIVGRDLLILLFGMLLLGGKQRVVVPSNILGKYAFAAIAVLLASYIIRFEFGITMMTVVSLAFIVLSSLLYARGFVAIKAGNPPADLPDTPAFRTTRYLVVIALVVMFLYKFYFFVFAG